MGKGKMKKFEISYEELESLFASPSLEKLDKIRIRVLMADEPDDKKAEFLKNLDQWESQTLQ
jgi:hypothetical protein